MRVLLILGLRWGETERWRDVEPGSLLQWVATWILTPFVWGLDVPVWAPCSFRRPGLETWVVGSQCRGTYARRIKRLLARCCWVRCCLLEFEGDCTCSPLGSCRRFGCFEAHTFLLLCALALDRKRFGLAWPPFPVLFVALAHDITLLAFEACWLGLVALEPFRLARHAACNGQCPKRAKAGGLRRRQKAIPVRLLVCLGFSTRSASGLVLPFVGYRVRVLVDMADVEGQAAGY